MGPLKMKLLLSSIVLLTLTIFSQSSFNNESHLRVIKSAKGSKVKKSKAVKSEKAAKGDKSGKAVKSEKGVEGSKEPKGKGGKSGGGYFSKDPKGSKGGGKGSKGGGKGSKGGGGFYVGVIKLTPD